MARLSSFLAILVGAGVFVSVATPSLAQQPAATTRFEAPASAAQGPGGAPAFVRERAAACEMDADALVVRQERVAVEPRNAEEEAALDAQVEEISAKAGFTGPKEDRQVSRASIRAMLTQRTQLTLAYTGTDAAAQMTCLSQALAEAGFTSDSPAPAPFTQGQADAISDACGADREWMVVHPGGEVHFSPPMEADYEASVCILQRIKDSGVTKFGFVGVERAYEGEADD